MSEKTDSIATYTRLRTGSWGVRVPEAVHRLEPGETKHLEVHKLNGQVKSEQVRCFWAGEDLERRIRVALCELVPRGTTSPA